MNWRLELTNFRCHRKQNFEFPLNGLILLDGPKGAGKSTIFQAMFYALYANVAKPYSFTTNTCKVKLIGPDIEIIRTNKPNRVVTTVWSNQKDKKTYEDAEAQGVINDKFGDLNEFLAGSYIRQKKSDFFLSMTAGQQLDLINAITFSDNTQETLNNKLKSKIQQSERDLSTSETKVEAFELQLSKLPLAAEMENPLMGTTLEEVENNEENTRHQIKDAHKKLDAVLQQIKKLNTISQLFVKIRQYEEELLQLPKPDHQETQAKYQKIYSRFSELDFELKQWDKLDTLLENQKILGNETEIINLTNNIQLLQLNQSPDDTDTQTSYANYFQRIKELKSELIQWEKLEQLSKMVIDQSDIDQLEEKCDEIEINLMEESQFLDLTAKYSKNKQDAELYQTTNQKYQHMLDTQIPHFITTNWTNAKNIYNLVAKELEKSKDDQVWECPKCLTHLSIIDGLLAVVDRELCQPYSEHEIKELTEIHNFLQKAYKILRTTPPSMESLSEMSKLIEQDKKINVELEVLEIQLADRKQKLEKVQTEMTQKRKLLAHQSKAVVEKLLEEKMEIEYESFNIYKQTQKNKQDTIDRVKQQLDQSKAKQIHIQTEINNRRKQLTFQSRNLLEDELDRIDQQLPEEYTTFSLYQKAQERMTGNITKIQAALSYEKTQIVTNLPTNDELQAEAHHIQEITSRFELQLEEYSKIKKNYYQYQAWLQRSTIQKTIHLHKATSKEIGLVLQSLYNIRDCMRTAALLSLTKTIQAINSNLEFYLEKMFVEPINVKIQDGKQTGKGKNIKMQNKINIQITLNNQEYDDPSQLSGGESDTINLALILSINDVVGSKILLLDESLSAMDGESNADILTFLRQNSKDKLILVTSHECVKGLFDDIITVDKTKSQN